MPPGLRVEVAKLGSGDWVHVNDMRFEDGYGSISDNHVNGRDIYTFGLDPVEGRGFIKKSIFGVDFEIGSLREITSEDFVRVATLGLNESYELQVHSDKSPAPRRMKFTYFED